MSEILDLKNHVMAMSSKINNIADMVKNSFTINDKMNELLTLMHQIGFSNQEKNENIFNCILPDLVKRIAYMEEGFRKNKKELKALDYVDFVIGKGKNNKVHMVINHDGVIFYTKDKSLFVEL